MKFHHDNAHPHCMNMRKQLSKSSVGRKFQLLLFYCSCSLRCSPIRKSTRNLFLETKLLFKVGLMTSLTLTNRFLQVCNRISAPTVTDGHKMYMGLFLSVVRFFVCSRHL